MVSPNPGLLAALLRTEKLHGLFRWKVNLTAELVELEASQCGWAGVWLDTSAASGVSETLQHIAIALDFPDYFDNDVAQFDAFVVDVFAGESRKFIAWSGWQKFVSSDPVSAELIADAFDRVSRSAHGVVLVCDSAGEFKDIDELAQM